MNPGLGVSPTRSRSATSLLLIFLTLTTGDAELPDQDVGNVGCLFSDIVCTSNEFCFNDLVIGQCISASSNKHVERLGPLEGPGLGLLEAEMARVFGLGFSWPDTYTQCVFQTLLADIRHGQPYSQQSCGHLAQILETQDEDTEDDIGGEEIGGDSLGDVFFVPEDLDNYNVLRNSPDIAIIDDDLEHDQQEEAWTRLNHILHKLPTEDEPGLSPYVLDPDEQQFNDDDDDILLVPTDIAVNDLTPNSFPRNYATNFYSPELYMDLDDLDNENVQTYDDYHPVEKREATLTQTNEDNDDIEMIPAHSDDLQYVISPIDQDFFPPDGRFYYGDDQEVILPVVVEDDWNTRTNHRHKDKNTLLDTIYQDEAEDVPNVDFEYVDEARDNKDDDEMLYYNPDNEPVEVESVFNRHGRLDVKKPGPFFPNSPNNFYLDKLPDDIEDEDYMEDDEGQTEYEYPLSPEEPREKKDYNQQLLTFPQSSVPKEDYLYINIKDRFKSLGQANKLWQYVADHLEVPKEVFSNFRPETSRIILKVNSNPRQLNATEMAKILEADQQLREHAKNDLAVDIEGFEVGDDKSSVMSVYSGPSKLFLLLFLLTAGIAALLLAAAVLLMIRRRTSSKSKVLQEESKLEREEPVKEYKQLVRDWSRSSRASQGAETNQVTGQSREKSSPNKVLGKTSQTSEGSRNSSTSSWQEEPGVNCMDISTGHMVLSYMEDHLNNKQRLEQEWVGLCAYEAEPNATNISFKVENKKKNRYPDKLPYDHNRVLLNALVNGSNSDYINASTVMDHDPRNPAYIITQGPMTNTVADFWQMVWEQGSVVVVMLSKLSENGYQLCHRYWPEEGSEQYHIFEVHLVSEHVWCDEYLVRSLYLKNNQTGETRTVTQFHFLSWPDGNTPTSTKAILEFRRKVNKSYRGRSCPMIVHCSDGVGRSGTYVLIDMVLNRMMKGSKEIDIAATLEHIRDQRSGMVQTRSQFEFCLAAVAEETHAILKSMPQ